eukprot:205039_1
MATLKKRVCKQNEKRVRNRNSMSTVHERKMIMTPWKFNDIPKYDQYIVFGFVRELEFKSKQRIPFAITYLCLQFHYGGPKDYFETVGRNIQIGENKNTISDTTWGYTNSCYGKQQIDGSIMNVFHCW